MSLGSPKWYPCISKFCYSLNETCWTFFFCLSPQNMQKYLGMWHMVAMDIDLMPSVPGSLNNLVLPVAASSERVHLKTG